MARKTIKQRLAELDAQRSALKARLSKTERNNDMRRKVLIGSLVLHHLETSNDQDFGRQLGEWLRRELPGFLTRDNDKALFTDLIGPVQPDTAETGDGVQGAP
ncbi:mobilization protein [Agrobacterium tumefaciens]|uniref:mobilization protein n=1 Tax=Agrobacterium tumefaciens TaxID=358 RepID=UPI002A116D76|nr:mobilization protein [Agrobacterium tumefaciens]MDX8326110.1 mobilization protein [Agrobacterium tumefaciens]